MKNLFKHSLLYLSIAALIFTYSCGTDEEEPTAAVPSIGVTFKVEGATATTAYPDDSISFIITASAEGQINRIVGKVSNGASSSTLFDETRTSLELTDPTEAEFGGFIRPDAEDIGTTWTFSFVVVDDLDQTDTATFEVDIIEVPSPEARSYSAILLAAPLGATTAEKTSETFFSTNTGMTYSMKEILESANPLSADIDFGYFYGSGVGETGATLSDPDSYPFAYGQAAWGARNSTTFRRTDVTQAEFLEITTFDDIDEAFAAATAADSDPGIESGLEVNEVLAFSTDADKDGGSKKGLILVTSITEGDGATGKIEIDIIVQEDAE